LSAQFERKQIGKCREGYGNTAEIPPVWHLLTAGALRKGLCTLEELRVSCPQGKVPNVHNQALSECTRDVQTWQLRTSETGNLR